MTIIEAFIHNHQFNVIKYEANQLIKQAHQLVDPDVEQAVRSYAIEKVVRVFSKIKREQLAVLAPLEQLRTEEEKDQFIASLRPYRLSFPVLSQQEVKKLFPKQKKLRIPEWTAEERAGSTYLGWKDIGAGKHYLIYAHDGQLKALHGRYNIAIKKGMCHVCRRYGDVALTTIANTPKHQELEKSFGQYICYDSADCNQSIRDVNALEQFIDLAKSYS